MSTRMLGPVIHNHMITKGVFLDRTPGGIWRKALDSESSETCTKSEKPLSLSP